jgi:hypothetical protein
MTATLRDETSLASLLGMTGKVLALAADTPPTWPPAGWSRRPCPAHRS